MANISQAHLGLHVLSVILPVDVARRSFGLNAKCSVPYLRRKAVLQVQKASLANVFYLCASLTYHRRLVSSAITWIPTKDCERAVACSA